MIKVGRDCLPGERPISLGFVGFHDRFNPAYNHVTLGLRDAFPIVAAEIDRGEIPDVLFFSVYGPPFLHRHARFSACVKIFTCEENRPIPWNECHYAMSTDRECPEHPERYLHLPIYAEYLRHLADHTGKTLEKPQVRRAKTKFCNFVYSNDGPRERKLFFEMLSRYKRVDSGGAVMNNLGRRVDDKVDFLEDYKFTIAFENSRLSGYISEKIVEPMAAGSIPIYWGDRDVVQDFNPRSFVDANEPEGRGLRRHFDEVIDRIVHLDRHDDDYAKMAAEPWFADNVPNKYCRPEHLLSFMRRIFSEKKL